MSVEALDLYDGTEKADWPDVLTTNEHFQAQTARKAAIDIRAAERFVNEGGFGRLPDGVQAVFVRGQVATWAELRDARQHLAYLCAPWFDAPHVYDRRHGANERGAQ